MLIESGVKLLKVHLLQKKKTKKERRNYFWQRMFYKCKESINFHTKVL